MRKANFADPEWEPTDEQLVELAHEAFAGVTERLQQELDRRRAELRKRQAALMREYAALAGRPLP